MFYKLGGKQLYYFNTNDGQGEIDVSKLMGEHALPELERTEFNGTDQEYDDYCESCHI